MKTLRKSARNNSCHSRSMRARALLSIAMLLHSQKLPCTRRTLNVCTERGCHGNLNASQPLSRQCTRERGERRSVGDHQLVKLTGRRMQRRPSTRLDVFRAHFTNSRRQDNPAFPSAEIFPKAKPTAHRYQYSLKDEPRAHLISDDWPATRCTVCTQQARNDARKT